MFRTPLLLSCVLLPGAVACTTSTATKISQSFRNLGFEETVFEKLFVIGVAPDQESRGAFENALTAAIVSEGGDAQPSSSHR